MMILMAWRDDRVNTFNDLRWDALSSDARQAAETLIFTQTSWDEDAVNPSMEKEWRELRFEQKRAAILLGYVNNVLGKWDDDDDSSANSPALPFEHIAWAQLPRNAKETGM